jgi:hypothetical protein
MSTIAQAAQQSKDVIINGKTFTNNSNLSKEHAIFAAYHSTLYSGNPPREGKLSTTTVIGPLRKAILAIKFPDSGTEDVANLMASSKGTAMHEGLTQALNAYSKEHYDTMSDLGSKLDNLEKSELGYICEQRVEREINGWKISGEFDVLTPDKVIKDFKFVSNYNIKKLIEDREKLQSEWSLEEMYIKVPTYFKFVAQLSIYKFLLNHPEVKHYGSILFSLNNGSDMGKYTIDQEVTFPLRPMEEIDEYLFNQIQTIKDHLANDTIPLCSDEERGYKPGEWKLQRIGSTGKPATVRGSKCTSAAELSEFIRAKGKPGDVEVITPPKYMLCEYCKFKQVCDQYIPIED